MNDVLKIILAILVILIAWTIIRGILGLMVGLAVAGLVVYGGVKLISGARR